MNVFNNNQYHITKIFEVNNFTVFGDSSHTTKIKPANFISISSTTPASEVGVTTCTRDELHTSFKDQDGSLPMFQGELRCETAQSTGSLSKEVPLASILSGN